MKHTPSFLHSTVIVLILTSQSFHCWSQTPYRISTRKELGFAAGGAVSMGLGVYFQNQIDVYTPASLNHLFATSDVDGFDRLALNRHSPPAANASDILMQSAQALPLLFLLDKAPRQHFGQIAVMFGETAFLNSGLTNLLKYTVRRPRPYVYDPSTSSGALGSVNAQASFVSGHTSATAASTFFMARVFSEYYPESRWKPVVWAAAAVTPAVTGYLRVRAGKHYPSDVIGGYLLGAAIGYWVPQLHLSRHHVDPADPLPESF